MCKYYGSRGEIIDTNTKECFMCKQDIDSIYDIHDICTECKVNIHHTCFLKIFEMMEQNVLIAKASTPFILI